MNNNEENVAILKDVQGRAVALKGVQVRARLHGLMAEVEVEQSYLNPQKTNIEAVYTFPLPIGAVLLGLEVEIAGKKLSGSVVERKQAERDYEDAVTDGDSAVMLQEAGPGLYTASIGNLMAGDSAVIRYRYGLMLSWQGPRLRFLLPTTIAPRYGDAEAADLQPHQVPVSAIDVEYPLELSITVEGELASAAIASPSHAISVGRSGEGVVVRLSGNAVMDRDFVLTIESGSAQSACVVTQDAEGQVAAASIRIPQVEGSDEKFLALKVVIDCSGSMGGTSITQARKAALEILNSLRPQDTFNVTLFGSRWRHFYPAMVPASARYITDAWNKLENLDADMGGTEMETALDASFSLDCPKGAATLLLLTDGEIYEHAKLVKRAPRSGHRVFTVGVGTAVADSFLQSLARTTGGACELVAPQEGMAERVLSQFHRMRQPKLDNLRIDWPVVPEWQTELPGTVFAGDTVHVFAGFAAALTGSVTIAVQGAPDVSVMIAPASEAEIPRFAAACRMETANDEEGLRLALGYQLLSRWTNFLVIAERADKAEDLPELQQIPQMLAAGWGGTGTIDVDSSARVSSSKLAFPGVFASGRGSARNASTRGFAHQSLDKYDMPAFLRKQSTDESSSGIMFSLRSSADFSSSEHEDSSASSCEMSYREADQTDSNTPTTFIAAMEAKLVAVLRQPRLAKSIGELERCGLDSLIATCLRDLIAEGHDEAKVIAAFIHALVESSVGGSFGRPFRRAILKAWKTVGPGQELDALMREALASVTADVWNWQMQATVSVQLIAAAGSP